MSTDQQVTILLKGGRLQSWHRLSAAQQEAYQQEHVNLMLATASNFGLRRLEGYRLIAPQGSWQRFWIIEFPSLAGAQAWIKAEMAPPYGNYGFFDYHLSHQIQFKDRLPDQRNEILPLAGDPHEVPPLSVEMGSVVVFLYEHDKPEFGLAPLEVEATFSRARAHKAINLERFDLIAPQPNWDRVWLVEFPTLGLAEAWIETEAAASENDMTERYFQLTRKWAPNYFVTWIPG